MSRSSEGKVQVADVWYPDWIKDIPDLTGKVAIVTGANSGTGFWAASALAGKGCTVVLACRSLDKANHAKQDILKDYPKAQVDVIQLDNMDFASVRNFAQTFNSKYDRLDYLLNNAGIMAQPLITSKDGYDIQFQTNHLAHFLLTKLLWQKLVDTPGQSRVINHSSMAHKFGAFDRNKMEYPSYPWGFLGIGVVFVRLMPWMGLSPIDNWLRYGMSKLCNILMMRQLQHKIEQAKLTDKVIAVACHPGSSNTGLQHAAGDSFRGWEKYNERNSQSAADGSLPLLMATIGQDIDNGDYIGPSLRMEMVGPPKKVKVGGYGNDMNMAEDLWGYSEDCIGEKFPVV